MRISTTTIESFRLWQTGDWMSEEDLQATIKGEFVPTFNTELGKHYHAILEEPEPYRSLFGYGRGGFQFEAAAIDEMLARINPAGVPEVKTARELLVAGAGVVHLVSKCDWIAGLHIDEFKTTLEGFDAEKYMASYQWRIMTMLFEATSVSYHVALLKDETEKITLRGIESLNVFPYPQLEADVRHLLREFVHYVNLRGLGDILRERQRAAEYRERTVVAK